MYESSKGINMMMFEKVLIVMDIDFFKKLCIAALCLRLL